jgi:uncharacterized protein YndB with AHSA1/START domain
MTIAKATTTTEGRDLVLMRMFNAPPEKVFNAWTDPALIKQWFAPLSWTVDKAETDVRPGGTNPIVMRSPEGQEFPGHSVYLAVIKSRRLVFTNAFTKASEPSEQKSIMVVEVTFEQQGDLTNYTARMRHWTIADREAHEKMGFHQGWATCGEQLGALVE